MTKGIGFLGCGLIGRAMLDYLMEETGHRVTFVQDPGFRPPPGLGCPVVEALDAALLDQTRLVVECATAGALRQNGPGILTRCDLMPFSVTAFADPAFYETALELCRRHGARVLLPHGAILGLDGIFDARSLLEEVSIQTVKSPQSLGRADRARTLVYEGSAREACGLYPRNVNVHAAVALAGLGFDKTQSAIISDPAAATNSHFIRVRGRGVSFELSVSSSSTGGITGAYTPHSARGSLARALGAGALQVI